ncbi:MAG: KH domain-containing protein [Clostridia bacterium]|nr:KH domain-containing protein [Clostridia bacterium]
MADYKLILSHIAKALVDEPDEVVVLLVDEDDNNVTLELSVAPDDMGKVIGKHGKIAKAIRTVMKAVANTDGKRVTVDIK